MIKIRKIKLGDVGKIYKMGRQCKEFEVSEKITFWPKEILYKWVDSGKDICLVAVDNNKIIGFIMSQYHKPSGEAVITNIYVDKKYRKQNIGLKLVQECLARLKEKGAWYTFVSVKLKNKKAIKFLKTLGFKKGYNFMWMEFWL